MKIAGEQTFLSVGTGRDLSLQKLGRFNRNICVQKSGQVYYTDHDLS
jgi:hypothetical protein